MDTKELLEELQKKLTRLQALEEAFAGTGTGKRKLTAAARKKIGAAQKKRWAKVRSAAKGK